MSSRASAESTVVDQATISLPTSRAIRFVSQSISTNLLVNQQPASVRQSRSSPSRQSKLQCGFVVIIHQQRTVLRAHQPTSSRRHSSASCISLMSVRLSSSTWMRRERLSYLQPLPSHLQTEKEVRLAAVATPTLIQTQVAEVKTMATSQTCRETPPILPSRGEEFNPA